MAERIFTAENVNISFTVPSGRLYAVNGAALHVDRGETLAVVGESGCGKSVLARAAMGLFDKNASFDGGSISTLDCTIRPGDREDRLMRLRRCAAMVLQDPMASLDPLMKVGRQIAEAGQKRCGLSRAEAAAEAVRLLADVGLDRPEVRARQYPHELSGGMRQRVVIAAALACRPALLICDEPTTALDVTVQQRVLRLIADLKKRRGLTIMFITHDLGVVAGIADRVAVMYAGTVVETGTVNEIFCAPRHPYTWSLLTALNQLERRGAALSVLPGRPPSLFSPPVGDPFAPRNPWALCIDSEQPPPLFKVSETHYVRSWLLDPRAPRVQRPAGASCCG